MAWVIFVTNWSKRNIGEVAVLEFSVEVNLAK
jgi:hypothetical protein